MYCDRCRATLYVWVVTQYPSNCTNATQMTWIEMAQYIHASTFYVYLPIWRVYSVLTNPATVLVAISWMYPGKLIENAREAGSVEHALKDSIHIAIWRWVGKAWWISRCTPLLVLCYHRLTGSEAWVSSWEGQVSSWKDTMVSSCSCWPADTSSMFKVRV